jgi:gas vesicle protein
MSRDTIGAGSVMLAFVVGAITGAAAALLFAPATGEETREFSARRRARAATRRARPSTRAASSTSGSATRVATAIERGREAFQQARERGSRREPTAELFLGSSRCRCRDGAHPGGRRRRRPEAGWRVEQVSQSDRPGDQATHRQPHRRSPPRPRDRGAGQPKQVERVDQLVWRRGRARGRDARRGAAVRPGPGPAAGWRW